MELSDVDAVAVLGAGTMGHGIAELAALAEYDVRLLDVSEELVREGYDQIAWSLEKLTEGGQIDDAEASAALDRIETFTDLDSAVEGADVVLEAVPEDMELKTEVFADLEASVPEEGVFASNTSTLSITELSEATDRPERVCGMHFFNPPVRMQLVEVISGAHTDEATLDLAESLASVLGKTPIRVRKDIPGFFVNRVLVPMLNEAAWLVETDEASVDEVDSTAKYDLGLPMGCFELVDQIGVDVAVDVLEYMHETLGERYEPCPLFTEKVAAGDYGRKTGTGFYDYGADGVKAPTDAGSEAVAERLVGVAAIEAAKLVADDVSTPRDIDEAVMLGAGFPEGLLKLADGLGYERIHETLFGRFEETGEARYEPSPQLVEWADQGGPNEPDVAADGGVEFETIRLEHPESGVAQLVLDRPDNLNSVNGTMLDELDEGMDVVEADADVRAMLVTGAGDQAFCGGADLQFMGDGLEPFEAVAFSRKGQRVFGRLAELSMPVVAGVDGFCLGGGMELATTVDICIAGESAEFGQPELNLGILPAWGGTQRLRHLVGERRAREIVLLAERYDAETMYDFGFVNEVVADDELHGRALEVAGDLATGAPLAQEATKNAMQAGRNDVEAGLQAESDAFGLLWTTEDTLEGIDAFHDRREPEFEGR